MVINMISLTQFPMLNFSFFSYKCTVSENNQSEDNESDLKTEIIIEEPDLEKRSTSDAVCNSSKTPKNDEGDKDEPEVVTIIETETENCDNSEANDKDFTRVVNENNARDEASQDVIINAESNKNEDSEIEIIQVTRNMLQRSKDPDDDEPASKKRRLAASEFLELTEANSSYIGIECNKNGSIIPHVISGDINTYQGYIQRPCPNDKSTDQSFMAVR